MEILALTFITIFLTVSIKRVCADPPYQPPCLANGQPDFQGMWVQSNATTLVRSAEIGTLLFRPVTNGSNALETN